MKKSGEIRDEITTKVVLLFAAQIVILIATAVLVYDT